MVSKYRRSGWYKESKRHALARKGVKTGRKINYNIVDDMINLGAGKKLSKPTKTKTKKESKWDKEFKEAQELPYLIDKKTGKKYKRIKYGGEPEDWGAKKGLDCHDCGAKPGQYHSFNCDVERSPIPGDEKGQLLSSERAGDYSA